MSVYPTKTHQSFPIAEPVMSTLIVVLLLTLATLGACQPRFCGYQATSDVREHAEIDIDQRDMEQFNDDFTFRRADRIYSNGMHSMRSSGLRTLRGFSTLAARSLKCEPYFELYRRFYRSPRYADRFVRGALKGTGQFRGTPNVFRSECATKGSQYQNVWMYVIHEMEDAINDCVRGDLESNDSGVEAWDEAAAFYCGSLPGPMGARDGVLLFTLAQKRCANFGTCQGGLARVNRNIRRLFNTGKRQLRSGNCDGVIGTKNRIVRQMTVPLVQGILRYVIVTDPDVAQSQAHAEGWAFTSAVLPLISRCRSATGTLLRENFEPSARRPMGSGVNEVANALYRTFGCLGISCRDVGTAAGLPRCSTSGMAMVVPGGDRPSCRARACMTC